MRIAPTIPVLAALALGCTEVSQEAADYDAIALPDPEPVVTVGEWSVRLTRAEVAFGPAYFCAAASGSSTLCSSSIAEVTSVTRIDALSGAPQRLGRINGFTGTIRSASYDLGISWFDTQAEPTPAPAAPGGHSMYFEAEASRPEMSFLLTANVDVTPQYQGQTAVPTAPAEASVDSSAFRLEVHFHAARWFAELDRRHPEDGATYLDALAAREAPAISPGSPEHNALLVGIKNLAPPEFRWVGIQR